MHSRLSHVPQARPWLVVCYGKQLQDQALFSASENRWYPRTIPDTRNKHIWTSKNEWLVLQDCKSGDCSLLSLVSMKELQLPKLDYDFTRLCILASTPPDRHCHVLFFEESCMLFCKPGDDKYVKQDLPLDDNTGIVTAATFEGKVYVLTSAEDAMIILECAGAAGSPFQVRRVVREGLGMEWMQPGGKCGKTLVESCGELLCVRTICSGIVGDDVSDFEVFRLDFSEMVWVKMDSIGERTIFLCLSEGVSYSKTEANIKGNCIYFTQRGCDSNLYVFDLDDRSIFVALPCPKISKPTWLFRWILLPENETDWLKLSC
ncbi:hypothetical protein RJ639_024341 [Escallonia herrerae]|uniref:KIB1-4 beta-propeller domain-containing protein n=1 Tax=Escallonia herrerae TaxID=1293975 RepID=A0AA89ADU5_9ASTE|nr:hypothetical protein RJ639_024341 [Escallonia herrerae]